MYFITLFNIPEDNPVLNDSYKEIPNFNGKYLISPEGFISNRVKILKTFINNSGYAVIKLRQFTVPKHKLIHRLVAETFLPNLENKKEVNHIDGNKLNNNVCNLEWVTSSENKQHAYAIGLTIYNNPTIGCKFGNSSKYHNVTWDSSKNRWLATVTHKGKRHFPKRFINEDDAALHVNWILNKLNLIDRPKNIV